jgi:hypothetical protein
VPETPAKTLAVGGSVKAGTPVYYCAPTIGEDGQEKTGDYHCTNQPMLLRQISISADNIPTLCLNDCPYTPSPLAATPGTRMGSLQGDLMQSMRPKWKPVKKKTRNAELDDSNPLSSGKDVQSHPSPQFKLSFHKHAKLSSKAPVDTAHQTFVDSTPKSSLGIETSHYDRSLDDEVKEIMQSAPARDIQYTSPSHSPLLGRKRNESTNSSRLMSDQRIRHAISNSPLSVGSSSRIMPSRCSTSPYETVVQKENGIITETTEC